MKISRYKKTSYRNQRIYMILLKIIYLRRFSMVK